MDMGTTVDLEAPEKLWMRLMSRQNIYSLYKKKCKHYIIFNNLRTFKDEHFKLTGDLDWHVPYQ